MPKPNAPRRRCDTPHPLTSWRLERGLTQLQLALAIERFLPKGMAVSHSTISRLEAQEIGRPSLKVLRAIVRYTKGAVSLDQLLPQ